MSRILVTGGSGFIGTNLIESLRIKGWEICNFDFKRPLNAKHASLFKQGDVCDSSRLGSVLRDFSPDYVVHLAARTDLDGRTVDDYAANTTGVRNIVEAVRRQPSVQRILFASSRYVHETERQPLTDCDYSPFTPYGESKVKGELIVRQASLEIPWSLVRPTSIWGPWFDIPYKGFFVAVRKGVYLHPSGEKLLKSYGYVGNVVFEIEKLLEAPAELMNAKTFYVADYEPIEIREFGEAIRNAFQAPPIHEIPLGAMRTLAWAGDTLKKLGMRNPPLTSFRLRNLRMQMVYDLSATETVAGPLPYSMKEGVDLTVEWMKEAHV